MINYGFVKELSFPFEEAVSKITEALQKEGFGVLTKIDLKEKFKEKLNVEFNNYVILGACNPPKAYESVKAEKNIGLLLPCNVVVYEDNGKSIVGVIKPTVAMSMVENEGLKETALEVEAKLKKVFDSVD